MLGLGDVNWQTISKCLWKIIFLRLLVVLAVLGCVKCLEGRSQYCLPKEPLYHVTLRGGIAAGDYMKLGKVDNYTTCAKYCCQDSKCDVAFMADDMCYNLHCYSAKKCQTSPSKQSRFRVSVTYIKRGTSAKTMDTILDRIVLDDTSKAKNRTTGNNTSIQAMAIQSHLLINGSKNALNNGRSEQNSQTARNNSLIASTVGVSNTDGQQNETVNITTTTSPTTNSPDKENLSTGESSSTIYAKTAKKIPKMMVYWKNDSHIVVKEVSDQSNRTLNSTAANITSDIKIEHSINGERTKSWNASSPITASYSPAENIASAQESSSASNRTTGSNTTNTDILLENNLSSNKANNSKNKTQEQIEKDLLDKSFFHANISSGNSSQDSESILNSEGVRSGQLNPGKSFQSKENGTQFDISNHFNGVHSINNSIPTTNDPKSRPSDFVVDNQDAQSKSTLRVMNTNPETTRVQTQFELSNPFTGNRGAHLNSRLSETSLTTTTGLDSSSPMADEQSSHLKSSILQVPYHYQSITPLPVTSSTKEKFNSIVNSNSSSVINLSIQQKTGERRCYSNGILYNKTLVHGLKSGDFSDFGVVPDMATCVRFCCGDKACNMALMLGSTCYTLHCASPEYCKVRPAHPSSLNPKISFVTQLDLPSVASARDRNKDHILPSLTPDKKVSRVTKRIKGSRCQHGSIQKDVTLKGGQKAGIFKLHPKAKDIDSCLDLCCKDISCNVAFLIDKTCYTVQCKSHEECAIVKKGKSSKVGSSLSVVRSKIRPMNDKRQQIPKQANHYVTVLNITNKVFSAPLSDFESLEFLNLGVKVQTAISMLLSSFKEFKESEVISFKPAPLMTKVKLIVTNGAPIKEMLLSIVKTLKAGKMKSSIDGVVEIFELSTFGFQFNSLKGFNMVCDPEFNYDVHWKLTVFDYQSVSPCPRKAKGVVRRSCHGSKDHNATWGFPSFVSCESSSYISLQEKAKSFANGAKKKIPFKTLQEKLKSTPNEILIQIQKLTFEDTYRAMLDMARKQTNKSLSHNKKRPLHDSKPDGLNAVPKQNQTKPSSQSAKSLFSNNTFSIPLPAHEGQKSANSKDSTTAENKAFSRENIPKPPQGKPAGVKPKIQGRKKQHIVRPPNIVLPKNPVEPVKNSVPSRPAGVPARISQNSGRRNYGHVRQSNSQVHQAPKSPYDLYKHQMEMNRIEAAQRRQKLMQEQQRQQQQQQQQQRQQQLQQRNSVFQNSQAGFGQPYQRGWQNNPTMFNQFPQGGQTGYGGVPGYGYAGFQDQSSQQEKELSRKKRDVELVRVKRQGGNLVWYNQGRPTQQGQINFNPTKPANGYRRGPILTKSNMGYDDPQDLRKGIFDKGLFQHPTPYYQTATYRLGENGSPTEMPTGVMNFNNDPGQRFGSHLNTGITGLGDGGSLTSATPGKLFHKPGRYGSNTNVINLITTSKPPLDHTTPQQTSLHPQVTGPLMSTHSSLRSTLSKSLSPTNAPHHATDASTSKPSHSIIDVLKKKLLDMTRSTPNTTTARPFLAEDSSKETNRAPMFGGDIAIIVDILRNLLQYNKYTNPPETINTLKQFLQVGSHILDKRNKHEWKFLTKEPKRRISALDAAEIIEDYSIMVAKKLPPRDMRKPILTTNILVALRSVDLIAIDNSKEIHFPDYSDPVIRNWTDATDTLIIRPQSLTNSLKGTKMQLVSCSIRKLTDLLPKSLVSKHFGNESIISGHVMSVSSIPSLGETIDPPIRIVLSNNNKDVSQFEEKCVFWEKGSGDKPGQWSSRGCKFIESNLSHTICECTHMSTFSAIANTAKHKQIAIATVPPPSPLEPEQSNVFYILLGILALLMIVLVVMAVLYLLWRRKKREDNNPSRTNSRGSGKSRSDESLSTGSEEFDDMMASRRRNVHPDVKKGPTNSPRWQRMRKNGENPEDLMLKEKSYLLSEYHQPYHFLSAKTPEPSSSHRTRSRSS